MPVLNIPSDPFSNGQNISEQWLSKNLFDRVDQYSKIAIPVTVDNLIIPKSTSVPQYKHLKLTCDMYDYITKHSTFIDVKETLHFDLLYTDTEFQVLYYSVLGYE